MSTITKATAAQAQIIHELVHQIYKPTYQAILSDEQIQFMLDRSYTVTALQEAMEAEQDFYLIWDDTECAVGFMALKNSTEDILRIEKLYLLPETQGKGYGSDFIAYAKQEAMQRNKSILELNVNRGNSAYFFYLKKGFKVTQEIDIPYFGYVLDDYIMQATV